MVNQDIINSIRPGDSVKVTIKSNKRFCRSNEKMGIGFIYTDGGFNRNATLFASIAWSDGGCSNSLLNRFDTIEIIKITK